MMPNKKEYHAVILGAMLHDIGKFVQRAQSNPFLQDHSHWGEAWFQNKLAEQLSPLFNENEKRIISSAIGNHHQLEEFISLADAISAGINRIEVDDEEKGDPLVDRLISIFSKVSISEKPKKEKYHQLVPLGQNQLREIFPVVEKKCSPKEYSTLLDHFEREIVTSNFQNLSSEKIINFFYFLLWKYCWCIPSATYKIEPDVPLFDHLKTTAAIAACLYAYNQENPTQFLDIDIPAFCLIGGDISGIQSFIFDVLTQQGRVAKRLRARSFFVQLISEIASHKILHLFALPLCNLIGSSGGNFYILSPNLKDIERMLNGLQKEFDNWTLKELAGELSVSIAFTTLSGRELANYPAVLDRLKSNLTVKKYQPQAAVLFDKGRWVEQEFLRPEVVEGDEKVCQACRKFPKKETDPSEGNLCKRCFSDTRIGQVLPKTKYLAFFPNDWHEYMIFGYSFELWSQKTLASASRDSPYLILSLNKADLSLPGAGFKYMATYIPTRPDVPSEEVEEGQPVTFDDLADLSTGDKLISYVKADVDNLGEILGSGFRASKPSISRFAAFSRMLETFFAGYLLEKLKRDFKEIYTIFSGGDDFFVLGPWDKSIEFVRLVGNDFSLYCTANPDLTFSAGVVLAKPHEPLSYCAEKAEASLKESKEREGKARITLFDQTVRWDELDRIVKESERIISWLNRDSPIISRSFVNNLRKYGEMAELSGIYEVSSEVKTGFLRFVPLLVDDIKRNLTRVDQRVVVEWVEDLVPTVDKPRGGHNLEFLRAISEYVLTYTRS